MSVYNLYSAQARKALDELTSLADRVFLMTDGADPAADAHDDFAIALGDTRDAFWVLLGLMVPDPSELGSDDDNPFIKES